jgi:alpha-L-rhamnosidase
VLFVKYETLKPIFFGLVLFGFNFSNRSMDIFAPPSQWIAAPGSGCTEGLFFRKVLSDQPPVKRALLRFSALGILEPWLNGERVGADWFTPGWSDYRKRAYLCCYDVTDQLLEGSNCLGFVLADGWAGAPFGPNGHAVALAPKTQFIAELEMIYADGCVQFIGTDESWCWRKGPILKQSIYHGETYDARRELDGWSTAKARKSGWKPVVRQNPPAIELTVKKCEPVRVTESVSPIGIQRRECGSHLVDFGQNLVGVVDIRLRNTHPGQRIVIKYAEMLQGDGSLYLANLRGAEATDVYICKGGGDESFRPRFTFHGFRYAQVEGIAGDLDGADIEALVLHNDLSPTGLFSSDNALVNKLQSCIVWGQRGNFLEAPTDCPQRDERLGWSCDAQVFVETACFNYDCEGFYRQWMDAMRDGQRKDGAFPDVAPDILGWHGNAGWGDAGIIVPHAVWLHYGCSEILEENWSAMERYLHFLQQRANNYIQPETVYGDWLAADAVKPEWGPTPKDLIGTAFFARNAQLMSRMATALAKSKKARYYEQLAGKIRQAFQHRYVTAEGLVLGDTQTSYLLALAFELIPERLIPAAVQRLVNRIEARNWHLSTGFIGTSLLNPVLDKMGRPDVAYRLLLQETYPSWLYSIRNGATTLWERWNSWSAEGGFGPVEMNSFNHYAYGAVGEWLYQSVAGIAPDPNHPGYARAIIAPTPGNGVRHVKASLKTRVGVYAVSWRITRQGQKYTIQVPKGGVAEVHLPAKRWRDILLNDKAVPAKLRQPSTRKESLCLSLSGGKFAFSIRSN